MSTEFDLSMKRFAAFLREVLEPAAYPVAVPLGAGALQIQDPRAALPAPEVAAAGAFAPVAVGWRWGPRWSTAWFRVRGEVPREMGGGAVALRFSSGTEAMLSRARCLLRRRSRLAAKASIGSGASTVRTWGPSSSWRSRSSMHERDM